MKAVNDRISSKVWKKLRGYKNGGADDKVKPSSLANFFASNTTIDIEQLRNQSTA